jgi:PAS domain S-box-containing protein
MPEQRGRLPANLDLSALGLTVLDAAHAARIGVAVSVLEPEGPRNVYVSEAAAEIMGRPVEELLSSPLARVSPDDLERMRERFARRTAGETGEARYEVTVVRKDGAHVPIEVTTSDVTIEGRKAVLAFIVDVSARRAAEQARLRTEARFRDLIEKGPEPIGIIRDGRIIYANPAMVLALGFEDAEQIYRILLTDLIVEEDLAALKNRMELLLAGTPPRLPSYIYRTKRPDGTSAVFEASSVPFEYEGKPSILTMARDVTERKVLQARLLQADRLAALGTMAAGVAHEINNPLAYLMLNLDWIARKLTEGLPNAASLEGLLEMLREARGGAERVAAIVRELRSFSRADGETRRPIHLASVVQSAIRIANHEVRHRARVSTAFSPVGHVWANEGRIEQVVLNLLLNAAQAMPESSNDTNEIRVSIRAGGDASAILEVSDNGMGIPPDVLPRIFDPFFTTKQPGVGTGLGLSICHGIIASLGGHITVHSESGQGTTFRIVLPTTEPRPDVSASAPDEDPLPFKRNERARVLVVDDEMQIANALRELLATEHDVVAAATAGEALATLRADPRFHVIFCDLMMPGTSGIEFFERIREEWPGLHRRVVFMTGGAFTAYAAEFLSSVDNMRIEKPFNLGLVERIVREMAAVNARVEVKRRDGT